MKKVKDLFSKEIIDGKINWDKFRSKLEVAIKLINEGKVLDIDGKSNQQLSKDITFKLGDNCIKLINISYYQGNIYCGGYQRGFYSNINKPIFPNPPIFI